MLLIPLLTLALACAVGAPCAALPAAVPQAADAGLLEMAVPVGFELAELDRAPPGQVWRARFAGVPGAGHVGEVRVLVYGKQGPLEREVDWLQPEREYHDGWSTFGETEVERDGRVALEVAFAILSHFRGVPGTTLSLWEHPSEPYRFWVSIELAPGAGRQRPEQLFGGTLTVFDGRLRMLDASVSLRPAQLEALAELALERKAAGLRLAALGVRAVDAREVEPPFWPPAEVVLVTTAQGSIEEVDTAWLEILRLEQSGRLWRVEEGCIQRIEPVEAAPERRTWLLGDAEVRLLRPRGPWCLAGAGPADHQPALVVARGERYRVVLGELER